VRRRILLTGALAALTFLNLAHATDIAPRKTLQTSFEQLVAPAQLRSGTAPVSAPPRFNVARKIEDYDLRVTLAGNWLGADWKAERALHRGHKFSAALEVREQLPFDVLKLKSLAGGQPSRKVGFATQNDITLTRDIALKVRTRYDDREGSGLEVGMERNILGGTRGRLSYAWQEGTTMLTGTRSDGVDKRIARASLDVPLLPKRLSSSFELQST